MGFTSRAQERRALAKGTFVPARRGRTVVGRAAGPVFPAYAQAGFRSEAEYKRARAEAARWSKAHSRKPTSLYKPSYQGRKFRAFYDAYVNPATRANRIENGLASLRYWLVEEMDYYTPEEFDTNYNGEL